MISLISLFVFLVGFILLISIVVFVLKNKKQNNLPKVRKRFFITSLTSAFIMTFGILIPWIFPLYFKTFNSLASYKFWNFSFNKKYFLTEYDDYYIYSEGSWLFSGIIKQRDGKCINWETKMSNPNGKTSYHYRDITFSIYEITKDNKYILIFYSYYGVMNPELNDALNVKVDDQELIYMTEYKKFIIIDNLETAEIKIDDIVFDLYK